MPMAQKTKPSHKPRWLHRFSVTFKLVVVLIALSQGLVYGVRYYKTSRPAPFDNLYDLAKPRFTVNLLDRLELRRMIMVMFHHYMIEILHTTAKADAQCVAEFSGRPAIAAGVNLDNGILICVATEPTKKELESVCNALQAHLLIYKPKEHTFMCERGNAEISF